MSVTKQLLCRQCRAVLSYNILGNPLVMCSMCQTVNVGMQVLQCERCHQHLAYNPLGESRVSCPCGNVSTAPAFLTCPNCRAYSPFRRPVPASVSCPSCRQTFTPPPDTPAGSATRATTTPGAGGAAAPKEMSPAGVPYLRGPPGNCKGKGEEDVDEDDEDKRCIVCLQKRKCVMLSPCGHMCLCVQCSREVEKCPLCRGDIRDTFRVFA